MPPSFHQGFFRAALWSTRIISNSTRAGYGVPDRAVSLTIAVQRASHHASPISYALARSAICRTSLRGSYTTLRRRRYALADRARAFLDCARRQEPREERVAALFSHPALPLIQLRCGRDLSRLSAGIFNTGEPSASDFLLDLPGTLANGETRARMPSRGDPLRNRRLRYRDIRGCWLLAASSFSLAISWLSAMLSPVFQARRLSRWFNYGRRW